MRRFLALIVRIFFRRVVITGEEHVPATGPLLLVLNHPNSLVDPLFLLALAPRRVVFLAKEPLFRIPVIGAITRAMGSIPVYRRMDGADTTQNRKTFEKVWEALARGGAIALFPEGTSHSDPKMRPFKTGTARMALGAMSINPGSAVQVIPAGLYYTSKVRFRSSALLCYGPPIVIPSEPLGADGEPHADSVRTLTTQLQDALARVTIQADEAEALKLVTRAERIFSSAEGPGTQDRDLKRQFELRQRFLRGYAQLRTQIPEQIAQVEGMLARYDAELATAGMAPENLLESRLTVGMVVTNATKAILTLIVLAPLGIAGIAINIVPYQFLVPLVTRVVKVERDVMATAKIFASIAAFPLVWTILSYLVWRRWGIWIAAGAWLAMLFSGVVALRFLEGLDRLIGSARGLSLRLFRPRAFKRLEAQRRKIREAILEMDGLIR
jgi:glycerol-3-phosphate O-acyltransferase / dihydroxyacetone phosphate acyltransferase